MNHVGVEGYYYYNCLESDFVVRHMAEEDESRTHTHKEVEADLEAGSTSKEEEKANTNNNNNSSSNWLQLSIGSRHQSDASLVTTTDNHHQVYDGGYHQMAPITGSGLVELDLLPGNRSHNFNWPSSSRPSLEGSVMFSGRSYHGGSSFGAPLLFEQTSISMSMSMSMPSGPFSAQPFGNIQQQQHQYQPHEMLNWQFHPLPHSMSIMPSSSSSSSVTTSSSSYSLQSSSSLRPFSPLGSYYPTPFHHFPSSSSSSSGFDHVAGPSSDITTVKVVDPPRRPHSGIWFMLQASQNQAKEPFLPQIPKSYLRIKDGKMTVRLLLKYLVSKLRLEKESEIEIRCRGQELLPFLTLQHVRDNIWTLRDTTRTLLSDSSSTIDHVMVLHYGRTIS
ncbi:hypothetical protein Lal_00036855 [Lupinus albus]|uniref:Uncharacterized protein n=1 Tax=Lupinus albus TaxID=3870 RepID=A0A6A4PTY0_LUPAL|nr:hypothetical protein Lalb_Chr10g0092161 [Lupinus albus]KAF1888813.1 hypothetical protein Lal_00036855 [Lupinus albus]